MLENWHTFILPDPVDSRRAELLFERPVSPEEKLMLAVLENAIEHFQEYAFAGTPRERALFKDTEDWFLEKDSEWFFSFENICDTLRLSPSYVRAGLARWKGAAWEERQKIGRRSRAVRGTVSGRSAVKQKQPAVSLSINARARASSRRMPAGIRSRS